MDVLLLKDVERLGAEGAVVAVRPGFARNYLIPRGLAAPATPQRLHTVEEIKRQRSRKLQRAKEAAEILKRKLEGQAVTLTLSVGEDGKSFGAVTTHDLAEAFAATGVAVDKRSIHLKQPIKTLGVHDVPVRLHPDVTAVVKVSVVKT